MPHSRKSQPTSPRHAAPDTTALLAEVRAIYEELAQRPIQGNCTGRSTCCRFQLTGKTPYLTRGEAMLAARAWRASGRTQLPPAGEGACPFLKQGLCQIYDSRPFGCRTHFCDAAGGPAPRALVRDLIHRLEEIDLALGGDGASHFRAAVSRYL